MKNLTKKLLQITDAADTVAKSGYNKHQQYSYSNEYDLHKTIKPLLKKHGVAIQWSVEEVSLHSNDTLALVKVKYTLTDVDSGETIESFSVGTGSDKQDKAVYKALTGAHKYFLQKMFMISGDDDPENDDAKKVEANKGSSAKAKTDKVKPDSPSNPGFGDSKPSPKESSDSTGFGATPAKAPPKAASKPVNSGFGEPAETQTPAPTAESEGFAATPDVEVPSGFGGKTPDVETRAKAPDVEF